MAHLIAPARDVLYLGRGPDYPMALEGALKLKEISYIHAEGYAAGEMKHGPIALIDEAVPVIVLAPSGPLFEKTVSNMQEVRARGGKIVLISDAKGIAEAGEGCIATIEMPEVHPLIAPLVYAVPVQLLAYHVAVAQGHRRRSAAQPREERNGRVSSGGRAPVGQHAAVRAQPLVEEVDHCPHARRLAEALVGDQPHRPAMAGLGGHAPDKIRFGIGDDARQDGNAEPRADRRQHAHRRGVVHDHPVVEPEVAQPGRISAPQFGPAAADEGMLAERGAGGRDAVGGGIVAAAIERPVVIAEAPADDARPRSQRCAGQCRLRPRQGRESPGRRRARSGFPGDARATRAASAPAGSRRFPG